MLAPSGPNTGALPSTLALADELTSPVVAPTTSDFALARRRLLAMAGASGAALLLATRPSRADNPLFNPNDQRNALRFADELVEMCADFFSRASRAGGTRFESRQASIVNLIGTQDQEISGLLKSALGTYNAKPAGNFFQPNALALPSPRTFAFPADAFDSAAKALAFGIMLKDTTVGALHGAITSFEDRALLETAAGIAGVQGRHAALLRDSAGVDPFPRAFEPALLTAQVSDMLAPFGFKGGVPQ